MKKLSRVSAGGLGIALLLLSFGALSADAGDLPGPCQEDAKKYCDKIAPGGGRILSCLFDKLSHLKLECRKAIGPLAPAVRAWRADCGTDIDLHCTKAPAGPQLANCLSQNVAKVGPHCKARVIHAEAITLLACNNDAASLCKDVKAGGGRVVECLAKNEAKLSPACKTRLGPVKKPVLAWRTACSKEIDQHCPRRIPSWGLLGCLESHESDLGATCKAHVKKTHAAYTKACAPDVKQRCKDVKPGEGRIHKCLQDNREKLRPVCAAVIGPPWEK